MRCSASFLFALAILSQTMTPMKASGTHTSDVCEHLLFPYPEDVPSAAYRQTIGLLYEKLDAIIEKQQRDKRQDHQSTSAWSKRPGLPLNLNSLWRRTLVPPSSDPHVAVGSLPSNSVDSIDGVDSGESSDAMIDTPENAVPLLPPRQPSGFAAWLPPPPLTLPAIVTRHEQRKEKEEAEDEAEDAAAYVPTGDVMLAAYELAAERRSRRQDLAAETGRGRSRERLSSRERAAFPWSTKLAVKHYDHLPDLSRTSVTPGDGGLTFNQSMYVVGAIGKDEYDTFIWLLAHVLEPDVTEVEGTAFVLHRAFRRIIRKQCPMELLVARIFLSRLSPRKADGIVEDLKAEEEMRKLRKAGMVEEFRSNIDGPISQKHVLLIAVTFALLIMVEDLIYDHTLSTKMIVMKRHHARAGKALVSAAHRYLSQALNYRIWIRNDAEYEREARLMNIGACSRDVRLAWQHYQQQQQQQRRHQ